MAPGGTGAPFEVRRRFEDRFDRRGKGFEGARIVYRDGRVDSRVTLDRSHFVENAGELLRKLKRGVALWLRYLGRGLYFAPLTWLAEWALAAAGLPRGWGIILLVVWVCVFFAFLNIYVWVAMLEHFRRRRMAIERPFDDEGSDTLGLLPPANQAIVGRVARMEPSRATDLWREAWLDMGDHVRRMAGGDHFVVVPDDGSPPIVCEMEAPPLVVGPGEREALASAPVRALFSDTIADGTVDSVVLRVGDAVALHAKRLFDLARVDHVEIDGATRGHRADATDDAPYRGGGGQPGRRATSTFAEPLRLRKLR